MNKNSIFIGIGGLIIGMIIGFFGANNLNKSVESESKSVVNPALPQVNNVVVRDQHSTSGAMMPEIAQTLDKAQNEPNNFEAQIQAGDLYLKIQNFTKALEFYETANKLKPDNYEIIVKLGNVYFDSQQYETAETWYAKALGIKPNDVGVRTDYGITFLERNDPARAIQEFQTSLKTDAKHEPTLYNLGIAYIKTGDSEQAKNIARQLEQINPQGELTARFKKILQ